MRVTNASDCGNADCVLDVGYSYWRNMNNHVGSDVILIVLTLDRAKGGGGPTLFSYNKVTDQVTRVRPLFDASNPLSWCRRAWVRATSSDRESPSTTNSSQSQGGRWAGWSAG